MYISSDVATFYKKNNINIDMFGDNKEALIYTCGDINPIIEKYGIKKPEKKDLISIADIIGYNYCSSQSNNLFLSMSYFFDSSKGGYQNRSVGLLDYAEDEIIDKLRTSFEYEPITLVEVEPNKYIIYTNGIHRYTILRAFYLIEKEKVKEDPIKLEKIRKK